MRFKHRVTERERSSRRGGPSLLPTVLVLLVLGNGLRAQGNITIKAIYDTSITANPESARIQGTIDAAIQLYQSRIADPITVTILFQDMKSGLGQSSTYFSTISYLDYRSALLGDATTADDDTANATLPDQPNNPVNGNASINVTTANLRALGFNVNPPTGQPDSTVGLNTSIMNLDRTSINPNKYDLMAVAMHEIDEALGFDSALNGLSNGAANPTGAVWGLDLFRYSETGARSLTTMLSAQAYFSIDGGTTRLARFNQNAGGDYSDWFSPGAPTPQVQDAFGTPGVTPTIGVELRALDVIGYDLVAVPEPSSTALMGLGLAASWMFMRKRKAA